MAHAEQIKRECEREIRHDKLQLSFLWFTFLSRSGTVKPTRHHFISPAIVTSLALPGKQINKETDLIKAVMAGALHIWGVYEVM